jgi:Ca2+-binding RTX toxin-like protein
MAFKFATQFSPNLQGTQYGDALYGDSAANLINGGDGADYINAGAGNDVINGGFGNDWLTGGTGADRFQFGQYSGSDVITDFKAGGGDKLVLGKDVYIAAVQLVGGGTLLTLGNSSGDPGAAGSHPTILLLGTTPSGFQEVSPGHWENPVIVEHSSAMLLG